jgi:hypothetical protein
MPCLCVVLWMPRPGHSSVVCDGRARNILKDPIWREIIARLNEAGVEYVLVGAAALVVHGLPRATIDIDLHVPAKPEVLTHLFDLAERLDLQSQQKDILGLLNKPDLFRDQWICFSHDNEDVLDVFLAQEKEFNVLAGNAVWKTDGDLKVRVASLDDIESMKRASTRPIDKADLELIREAKRDRSQGAGE